MPGSRERRRVVAALAALVTAGILLVGCAEGPLTPVPTPTPSESLPPGDGVLRIGTLLPTSGENTQLGPGLVAAVRAAVREMNAAGGVLGARVELISRSSGGGIADVEAAVAELIAAGVDALVGPTDASTAVRVAQLAAEAHLPVIAVGTGSPQISTAVDGGWLFRTTPALGIQGSALGTQLIAEGARSVALVTINGPSGMPILDGLGPAVRAGGGEVVSVMRIDNLDSPSPNADVAGIGGVVARLTDLGPDAIVVATADGGDDTRALIRALADAGLGGATLWLASGSAVDYSDTDAAKAVVGAHGIRSGAQGDADFQRRVKQEDPGAKNLSYAADAYDATLLLGLAALAGGGDAGWQLRAALPGVSAAGSTCSSFGECAVVIRDGQDPDYTGVSGPIDFDPAGDVSFAAFSLGSYTDKGALGGISAIVG